MRLENKFTISNQLLYSGTSVEANSIEEQNAERKAEFFHNIKISAKETDETQYWLGQCDYTCNYPDYKNIINKLSEIQRMLNSLPETFKLKNLLT